MINDKAVCEISTFPNGVGRRLLQDEQWKGPGGGSVFQHVKQTINFSLLDVRFHQKKVTHDCCEACCLLNLLQYSQGRILSQETN